MNKVVQRARNNSLQTLFLGPSQLLNVPDNIIIHGRNMISTLDAADLIYIRTAGSLWGNKISTKDSARQHLQR